MPTRLNLSSKTLNLPRLAEQAAQDPATLQALLANVLAKDDTVRSNVFNTLEQLSESAPKALYPHWEQFAQMLTSSNNFHVYIAIHILANLASVDTDDKFAKDFAAFFAPIKGDRAMTAGHAILATSKIVQAKPTLEPKITAMLLNIDTLHQGKQTEMLKGYAIEAFGRYYEHAQDKEAINNFARQQLGSNSPITRKLAHAFIREHA
jgi:hypothetical protein